MQRDLSEAGEWAGEDPPLPAEWIDGLVAPRPEPDRGGSAPDPLALKRILASAARVPDHGNLRPWRFALIQGEGRDRFGEALVAGLESVKGTDLPGSVYEKMRGKAFAAPCSIMVIASPDDTSNVAVWEQVVSASCTGYAIVLAATGLGYGAVWKSAPVLESGPVRSFFGLDESERLLGWVNLGTADHRGRKKERNDPIDVDHLLTVVGGDG
jgi:nitroreductase